jgi:hypothetical protein
VAVSGVTIPARTIPIPVSAIQVPAADGSNHATILRQLKESVEVAARQRGDTGFSYVRANEIVALGLGTMVNGALQLTGGSAAGAASIPAGVGAGGVSGPGVGTVGATGAAGLAAIGQSMYPEDQDDAAPFARFQLPMLDQMGSKVGGVPYRTAKGWVATPLQTLTLGLPVLIQDDPDDQLMIPGATGAVGAAGKAGTNAMFVWPDDPEDPMIVPGTPGAVGATGSSGAPGLPGASAPVVTWPDDPDDAHIVPGPIGLTGIIGPAGFNAPQLYPDDMEDSLIVPGPKGLTGLTGASGYNAPQLYPDDPDDPLVIPGLPGAAGAAGATGAAGQISPFLYPDDVDDALVIPGPTGQLGPTGAQGSIVPMWSAYGDYDFDDASQMWPQFNPAQPQTITGAYVFEGAGSYTLVETLTTVGVADYVRFAVQNTAPHAVQLTLTSTGYVGAWLPNGVAGESANFYTVGAVPLMFGTNSVASFYIDTTHNLNVIGDSTVFTWRNTAGNTILQAGTDFGVAGGVRLKTDSAIYSAGALYIYAGGASTPTLGLSAAGTTGAKSATFTSTNKPGTTNQTTPAIWLPVTLGGTLYYMPLFAA